MIKLYLAEDQSILNSALKQLLDLEDDFSVIGSALDGFKAWNDLCYLKPDIAILDIEMPKLSGLDIAERIHDLKLPIKVIVLTTFAHKSYFERAVKAQVSGYLLKDISSEKLIDVIHQAMEGNTFYSPELVVNMISVINNPLTKREIEILNLAQSGLNSKEIATKLFLSDGTVRNYFSAIFSKLGVHNRIEAINLAQKYKWLKIN
ncbi:MAG: response regulator [Lactobacillaceae bacterium]